MNNPYTENVNDMLQMLGVSDKSQLDAPELIELVDDIEKNEQLFNHLKAHYLAGGYGATFKHASAERYAFILPDAGEYHVRFQIFDKNGLVGHQSYNDEASTLAGLIAFGFTQPAPMETFNELSKTDAWVKGTERLLLIERLNSGVISYDEFSVNIEKFAA